MKYRVEYSKKAIKSLKKMDKNTAEVLVNWIGKNLDGTEDPRKNGKDLKGNLAEYWRYRVGDYRVVVTIKDDRLLITCVDVGHRKQVYKRLR